MHHFLPASGTAPTNGLESRKQPVLLTFPKLYTKVASLNYNLCSLQLYRLLPRKIHLNNDPVTFARPHSESLPVKLWNVPHVRTQSLSCFFDSEQENVHFLKVLACTLLSNNENCITRLQYFFALAQEERKSVCPPAVADSCPAPWHWLLCDIRCLWSELCLVFVFVSSLQLSWK